MKRSTIKDLNIQALRDRLVEAEETIEALRNGAVDALVISENAQPQVFALNGADQPYRVYVERMQEGAVTVSEDGTILFCNARFSEMLRVPMGDVMGSSLQPHLPSEAWEEIRRVFANEGVVVKHPTGLGGRPGVEPLQVLLTASQLPLPGQKVMCLVATDLHDQLENVRLRMARDLAQSENLAKDNFLAVLSHELRTPLTPVVMAISALEDEPGLSDKVREQLAMMKRNIELETKLIDDLLDVSGIVTGKLRLELEPVDLNHAIDQVCAICRSQAEHKSIHIEVVNEEGLAPVAADPSRLHQVLWNVLKNAIKFSPAGGTVSIRSAALPRGRSAVIVQDKGIGIPQESLGRIFDAFEQGNKGITRRFGGLGLGLAISKALISLHGGTILASSEGEGKGATFTIELPRSTLSTSSSKPKAESGSKMRGQGLCLLLVEDHEDTARALGGLLKAAGFSVLSASSVASATQLASEHNFDLLVSDLGLPDGDGYELMSRVQSIRETPGIAMSGFGMEEDVRRCKDAGFSEHLVKPIDIESLFAAIQRIDCKPILLRA